MIPGSLLRVSPDAANTAAPFGSLSTLSIELSIVMPCLNEARTLPICIRKARRFLDESGIAGEIIVADNGSTDGSIEIAESLGARVVRIEQRGYGAALSGGIYAAHGEFVIMGDCDDSYDFLSLQPFVDKLRRGYDLVMGNRFEGGISRGAMPPMHRYFGNPLLSFLGRTIYGHRVCGDFYCGLRGFRKEAVRRLHVQSRGMEFALEMIVKATLYRLRITEVPTTLSPDGRDRKPHLRTYRDGWRSLRLYLLMSPRWVFGVPGIILAASGLAAFGVSWWEATPHWFSMGLLAYAAGATVLGYQSTLLAIFAKFIAIEVGLHPPKSKFWMLREPGTLERFIITGALVAAGSIAAGLAAGFHSASVADDPLGFSKAVTFLFLAAILLITGGQTILAGFCFGLLDLLAERRMFPRKRRDD